MRALFLIFAFVGLSLTAFCQADSSQVQKTDSIGIVKEPAFYYYIIGNWRNGPEVLIGPVMAGSEQKTMEQMKNEAVEMLLEFKDVKDTDIVVEPSIATAEHSRRLLGAKYQSRALEVKLLKLN